MMKGVKRRKIRSNTKKVFIVACITFVLAIWFIFTVVRVSSLHAKSKVRKRLEVPKRLSSPSREHLNVSLQNQREPRIAYDKDYLGVIERMRSGKANEFGSPSERDISKNTIDIVLNIDSFGANYTSTGLESMITMFCMRSIEKYFMPFNSRGKVYALVQTKNDTTFSEWQNGGINVIGYNEIFPSPDNNLPTGHTNAVKANLRNIPNISNLDSDALARKKKSAKNKSFYRSLIETNKLVSKSFTSELPPSKTKQQQKQLKNKMMFKSGVDEETKHSIFSYNNNNIAFFRKPVLDYMYEMWPHEFARASNSREIGNKDFDISFAYTLVSLNEDIAVDSQASSKTIYNYCGWGTKGTKNDNCVSIITSPKKEEAFTLSLENDLTPKSKETERLQKLLCALYPEKSSLERLDILNPCDKFK